MRFALEEFSAVLDARDISGEPYLLIGGQAVYFWASRYASEEPALDQWRPFTSKDIDFQGGRDEVLRVAKHLGVKALLPGPREMTALAGIVPLNIGEASTTIEFVRFMPGVRPADAIKMAAKYDFRDARLGGSQV